MGTIYICQDQSLTAADVIERLTAGGFEPEFFVYSDDAMFTKAAPREEADYVRFQTDDPDADPQEFAFFWMSSLTDPGPALIDKGRNMQVFEPALGCRFISEHEDEFDYLTEGDSRIVTLNMDDPPEGVVVMSMDEFLDAVKPIIKSEGH